MMKRFLIILVMVTWCSVGFAISQQEFIDKYLEGRKLDQIEGVWLTSSGKLHGFFKTDSKYNKMIISSGKNFKSGEIIGYVKKGSKNIFYGEETISYNRGSDKKTLGDTVYKVQQNSVKITYNIINDIGESHSTTFTTDRLWPNDLKAHNAKFGGSDLEKIEMASMIDKAKDTCKILGFEEGTEKFADCSLKLYSQSVELAAKNNQQIVIQGQSSGSNVMTIYDPVRDSNAAIKRGQGLINGTCTLGDLSNC
jgi:hypothetical protein